MLSECQIAERVESCRHFVQRFEREGKDLLSRIVTADETWISLYEPESKEQSTMWKTHSTKKQMFIMFLDIHAIILSHAIPPGETVTANYYSKVSLKSNNI